MDALTVALCCLLTVRLWWLVARDTISEPARDRVLALPDVWPWKAPRAWVECPWCGSVPMGFVVAVAAWHLTDVSSSWLWWIPAVALVSSLVTALVVYAIAVLERLAE